MSPANLKTDRRVTLIFWAVTLIGGGLWLLLINFNLLERFEPTAQYILAGVLAALGLGFFGAFLARREKWWRLIPGWLLLTLAVMVLLSTRRLTGELPAQPTDGGLVGEAADGRLIASVLFGGMALSFLHVYLLRRSEYWWAIIPSGFMLVLGGVVAASIVIVRLETLGALLSVGMGLVFVWLYGAARKVQGWWPLIPATVLILFGVAAFTAGSGIQNVVLNLWPVLLILVGFYLGRLAWPSRAGNGAARERAERLEVHTTGGDSAEGYRAGGNRKEDRGAEGVLGAYTGPAPGTSVDVLDDEPINDSEKEESR